MNEEEMIENMMSINTSDQENTTVENNENHSENNEPQSQETGEHNVSVDTLVSAHDYVVRNIDKLSNGDLINDNIHQIDEEIDIQDSLIFNDKTNHKCVVIDCKNLYVPQNFIDGTRQVSDMICCQSGVIVKYDDGRVYLSKNNLFIIDEENGKVKKITTYYRAKKGSVKYNIQDLPMSNFSSDIDMIKFAIKSRCVRIYNSIKDETDVNNIYSKLMDHYNKVVDINNLIKIESLRFDIGC